MHENTYDVYTCTKLQKKIIFHEHLHSMFLIPLR